MTAKVAYWKKVSNEMRRIIAEKEAKQEQWDMTWYELRQDAITSLYVQGVYEIVPF